MHHIHFVQGLASGYNLAEAFDGEPFRKPFMQIQKVLQAAPIAKVKDAVVVRLGFDDLLHVDHVGTVYHRQEDYFSAQGKHTLLPILGVTLSLLVYPIIRCNFSRIFLTI